MARYRLGSYKYLLYVGHDISLRVYLVEDILHVLLEEVSAAHGAKVVEGPTLDEDQDVEVLRPELALAPLQAHVLQHRALANTCGEHGENHQRPVCCHLRGPGQ